MAIEVLLCYAHKDERLLNNLKTHLKALQREKLVDFWYDRDISAGTEWEREIDEHLNSARIILLLVSPDFINSDYCYSVEMQKALDRHEGGEARTIPIILRPTDWQNTRLGRLQALPKDGKPLITWHPRDNAYVDVAKGLRKAIEEMGKRDTTSASLAKQDDSEGQGYQSKKKGLISSEEVYEEALAKLRDEMQRQREADNLLLEARKFASSLLEKEELVKKAVDLWPPYKQRELRQLGIEISTTIINGYDPVTQRGLMMAGLGKGMTGYWRLERNQLPSLAVRAITYLRENVLETTVPDAEGLLYLACMYGYQQQFEDMIRTIRQAIKIDKEIKVKFQQRKIQQMLLRTCDSEQIKLERLRKSLGLPHVTKKFFCQFLQDFDLTNFNGFIEWTAIKRPNVSGERGPFLIQITPPYPSNDGKVSASAQSIESWGFETVVSNTEPVTVENLYDTLHSSFILFCPIS